jgi:hypothetical protein
MWRQLCSLVSFSRPGFINATARNNCPRVDPSELLSPPRRISPVCEPVSASSQNGILQMQDATRMSKGYGLNE